MFEKFVGCHIKPNHIYRAIVSEDGDTHLVVRIDERDIYVYISETDKKIKDPRFNALFETVSIESFINGLPEIAEMDLMQDWLDGKILEEEEEEENHGDMSVFDKEEVDQEFDVIEIEENSLEEIDSLLRLFIGIKDISVNLSVGVLEALRGVEIVSPGHLIEEDRSKLLDALKRVIDNFDKSKDLNELLMAQYLLFNIINLAKNNWNKE